MLRNIIALALIFGALIVACSFCTQSGLFSDNAHEFPIEHPAKKDNFAYATFNLVCREDDGYTISIYAEDTPEQSVMIVKPQCVGHHDDFNAYEEYRFRVYCGLAYRIGFPDDPFVRAMNGEITWRIDTCKN